MGGYSEEFEISIKSGNNILKNIDTKLFNPYAVIIKKNNWKVINEGNEYSINESDFSFKIGKNKITIIEIDTQIFCQLYKVNK